MQFKVITTILLFFVAQTMATRTGSLQTRDDTAAAKACTLAFMVLSSAQTNHDILRLPQAIATK